MADPGPIPAAGAAAAPAPSPRELLLVRRGLVFLSSQGAGATDEQVRAIELELADLGYVLSNRLRTRLLAISVDELTAWRAWVLRALGEALGADRRYEPLFRSFPEGIPSDTTELWWHKVLTHYFQAEGQPCLFCRRVGTTHVLAPCRHVVCDHCWDGGSYSACPVCEHHVDRSSPFFKPSEPRQLSPDEKVVFKLLDLGADFTAEARAFFTGICERKQALSPDDRDALVAFLRHFGTAVLPWLPDPIPVRENIALVFGTLFRHFAAADVLPHARRYMTTATDVLRFLAVYSDADASLQKVPFYKIVQLDDEKGNPLPPTSWWQKAALRLGYKPHPGYPGRKLGVPVEVHRFKIARLSRALRRALLAILEGIPADRLTEDMLRHRSYWVWVGELLHPSEYAARYPNVAAAFAVVRRKGPDGKKAPRFRGFHSKVESLVATKDAAALAALLAERPGELARRFDLALRIASTEGAGAASGSPSQARVVETFVARLPAFATPVVLTLRGLLPTRGAPAKRRLFWPKGQVAKGVSAADRRPPLPSGPVAVALRALDEELLARFAKKPAFHDVLIDEALRDIVVPFNERTASRSAVSLPRGSRVQIPASKGLRLFMHWCQPAQRYEETDLDLSVGFYDERWNHTGVCSYYQLELKGGDGVVARSAGDMRDAPHPDGATELVDVDRERALAAGHRWAVMVVNAYSGMPFDALERAFAGVMLRDDLSGAHFDPRTVELKFALAGANGVFMPLVLDLRDGVLHWLDVYSQGQLAFNNVATSNGAITKICPEMMDYFASGVRPSMFELGLYHAAARGRRVYVRPARTTSGGGSGAPASDAVRLFVRREGESTLAFHQRLVRGEADEPRARPPRADGPPLLGLLHRGDIDLPAGSVAYALFRERVTPSLSGSDLLS